MAELHELQDALAKMQEDMAQLKTEAAKADKLQSDLAETRKLVDTYKSGRTVYINKDRRLDKFSGRPVKATDPTVEEWIEDAAQHLKTISSNDAQIEYLYDHLTGQARDEIRMRSSSEKDNAAKILDILRITFQEAETVGQLQQKFYQRNQRPGESLLEFSLSLMKVMDRITKKDKSVLGDRDLMLRERFTDGVLDSQLRREMRRFSFEHKGISFTDFRQMILRWTEDESPTKSVSEQECTVTEEARGGLDKVSPSGKESVSVSSTVGDSELIESLMIMMRSQQELLSKQQEQLDKLTKAMEGAKTSGFDRVKDRRPPISCYACGGPGHISRQCPHKRKKDATEYKPQKREAELNH